MVQKLVLKNVEKGTVQRENRPVWNNTVGNNHQSFFNSRSNFAPTVVLTKSGIVPISTARQSSSRAAASVSAARPINIVASIPLVNVTKPTQNALQTTHSLSRKPFQQQIALKNRNLNNNVNAAKANSINTAKGNKVTSVVGNQGINAVKRRAKGGKINGKGTIRTDEGIFVGYSTTSKAFRVYNIRTRKVEENLHITFLENKTMIVGGGPEWLFDIDALSKSMNYAPVSTGTNSNDFADNSLFDFSSQASDSHKKDKHGPSQASKSDNHERPNAESSTKTGYTAGPVNTATPTYADYPNDPLMPDLEDVGIFDDAYDDRNKGVEAMQEELLQFKLLNVWKLVDLPPEKRAIGTKWVYRNKRDQRGIFVRNKARLFPNRVYKVEKALYGLHQAPRAGYETLSIYILDNRFRKRTIDKTLFIKKIKDDILLIQVYVDDIIFGSTKRSLRLQVEQRKEAIFLSQDKYVNDILKKFGFSSVKSASTPMETHKPLLKDANGTYVDVHLYRSMIDSLMYLTSSRPDIMFAVCACLRFQVQPKLSHMHAMKRIFRYLKGQPILGLWYPKDSPLELIAYFDSDYAGANLNRKSTTGGCQFLDSRLISWQFKKQTIVANFTTEAEYIAASNSCGLALWLQNQLLDYGYNFMHTKIHANNESAICVVKNPTKHIEIRHHFIRDSYEKRLIEMVKIHTDYNVADLLTKAFDVTSGEDCLKLKELMDLCTNLSKKVIDLESEVIDIKSTYKAKFKKLESRVKRLEEDNMVLKELKGVHSTIDYDEPVMEKEESSKQGKTIVDIDADVEINLEKVQAEAYNLDLDQIERLTDVVMKYQALKRKPLTEAQARRNMIVYLKNIAGYKMNYFKGISYDEIRPLFKKHYNYHQAFINEVNEGIKVPKKEVRQEKEVEVESSKREEIFLLVEKMYPLTHFTLEQMVNDDRLEVDYEIKMSLELLKLVRR
nr:hypothetical protein [Tanacetum cinerariifolium]